MYAHDNVKYATLYKHHRSEGGKATREYRAYRDMLNRCYYKKHNRYHRYGGRGIQVCPQWLGSGGFDNFCDDMGKCPEGLQLDRIENDEDYSPGNCKWSTRKEQGLNRSTTRKIEYNGQTKSIVEWAEETGIPAGTLERRLNSSKMSVAVALNTPVGAADKSHKLFFEFRGERKSLKALSDEFGIPYDLVRRRLTRGWDLERALTTPSLREEAA